jgi:hypothetical protein
MKSQLLSSLALLLCAVVEPGQCFPQYFSFAQAVIKRSKSSHEGVQVLFAKEREDFVPETSFGAEVVPEGQRPVNEYLEMRRSPLFEWASNEVGTNGVSSLFCGE